MNMKKTTLLLACALLALCCGKEEKKTPGAELDTFTITSPLTKLSLGQATAESYPILWNEEDQVKFYNTVNIGSIGTASLESGAGTPTGTFKLARPLDEGLSVRAVYPADRMMSGKNRLDPTQSQAAAGAFNMSRYSYCWSDVFESGKTSTITLHHAMAYLRIVLNAGSMEGFILSKVGFTCEGQKLAGGYKYDYNAGVLAADNDASAKVEVSLEQPAVLGSGPTEVWLALFPCTLEGKSAVLDLEIAPEEGALPSTQSISITAHDMLAGGVTTITVSDLENADIEKGDPNATVEYTTVAMNFKAQPDDPFKEYQARTAAGMNRMDRIRDGFSIQDKWGGYDGIKPNSYISTNTSGFWRTGRWHDRIVMVDPDGNVAVLRGMNYLLPEPMCASSTPTTQAIFEAKYKDMNVWAADAASMLHGVGFNMYMVGPSIARDYRFQSRSGYGVTEAMDEIMHNPSQGNCLSQVEWLNFLIQFWWDYKNLYDKKDPSSSSPWPSIMFDPGYLDYIDEIARTAIPKFRESKHFIGYYSDNELNFDSTGSRTTKKATLKNFLALNALSQEADAPRYLSYAYNWAIKWMQDNYGTTTYNASMESAFMGAVADYYYRTASEAIRRYDPNHLYMGSRLHADDKFNPEILKACARYCDVISINYYTNLFEPDVDYFETTVRTNCGEKPFIITEFYVKDMVSDSKYVNEGAGDFVDSQKARGLWYSNFCIRLMQTHNCAGWQWFKFYDDWYVNGYVNKGIFRYDETGLYTDCTDLMKQLNRNTYQILSYFTDLDYTPQDPGTPDPEGTGEGFDAGTLPEVIWE